jgi:xanthine dehydrogenase accessory factor
MTDDESEHWSVPESAVMRALDRSLGDDSAVLATIIDVEGNAFRRPGAKMVVSEQGAGVGSITAGCLEDEVLDLAAEVRSDGRARVEQFDLTGDDDVWGLGLGCNGIIDLLVEPLTDDFRPVVDAYGNGEDIVVLTVLDGDGATEQGDRMLVPDGDVSQATTVVGDWPEWLVDQLEQPVETLLAAGQSDTLAFEHEGETVRVFVDSVTARPDLVVFGTGHDVTPVVELADRMDFRVTVVGFRGGLATAERFPNADRVLSTSPAQIHETLAFDEDTYAVVMTHNVVDDTIAIEELLETETPYIGLMGPTERFEEVVEDIEADREPLSDAELDRIYTPVGLDLGGGTPYQIALSIVGEVQAVANERDPKHLRDRKSPIHERVEVDR